MFVDHHRVHHSCLSLCILFFYCCRHIGNYHLVEVMIKLKKQSSSIGMGNSPKGGTEISRDIPRASGTHQKDHSLQGGAAEVAKLLQITSISRVEWGVISIVNGLIMQLITGEGTTLYFHRVSLRGSCLHLHDMSTHTLLTVNCIAMGDHYKVVPPRL